MPTTIINNAHADKLQGLGQTLLDMSALLHKQRDVLSGRGIQTPVTAADETTALATALEKLAVDLANDTIELAQLREVARTTEIIISNLDLDTVLNNVLDTCISLTGAERGYIMLQRAPSMPEEFTALGNGNANTDDHLNADHPPMLPEAITEPDLELRSARNVSAENILGGEMTGSGDKTLVISRTLVNQVAQSGELMVTTNAEQDSRFTSSISVANYALRSILCVPLKRKGIVIGVLYLDNRIRPGLFSPREQRLITAFANQSAVAIDNARLFERVRDSISEVAALRDFMENIFASIASGVIATDEENRVTQMNYAAARILGLQREDCIGASLWSVLPPLYAGFRATFEGVRVADLKQTVEADVLIPGRGQLSLNIQLAPLKDPEDVTRGVTLVLDDLTELKTSRAQLSAVRRYLPPALVDNIHKIDELELGGVERDISLVACDVRGFSTFSENLSPEDLMTTINQFLGVSTDAIHAYDGIVDKYMGDAAVGIFNSQLNPQDDHTLRAVHTAVQMIAGVRALHEQLAPESRLLFGIGVHTGRAILGNVGSPRRKEFTVIGDVLSDVKTIQDSAPGGEVYLSEAAYHAVQNYVEAEPAAPRKGKESSSFMLMYRVVSLR